MCTHITSQVLEETQLFFDIWLGPNDFTNRGPRRFPRADLGGLMEDVRQNNFLDLVTMPRQWNNQENINTWGTHQGNIQGRGYASKWVFPRQCPKANTFRHLFSISNKCNAKFTREEMADAKPRKLPSSACQTYRKVLAKIFHTLFHKGIGHGKQNKETFSKIWGKLTR